MRIARPRPLLTAVMATALIATACGAGDPPDAGPDDGEAVAADDGTDTGGSGEEPDDAGGDEPVDDEAADGDPDVTEVDEPSVRLLVADATEPTTTLLDLSSGEVVATYEHASPARLYVTPDRRFALISQYEAGVVEILDGGAWSDWHGDHGHHYTGPPRLLDTSLDGERPAHVHVHRGEASVFFDGLGQAITLQLDSLVGDTPTLVEVATSAPHHGVVVPTPGGYVVTVPDATSEQDLPRGVEVRDTDGTVVVATEECGEIHGEALVGDDVVFACEDGLLVVAFDADGPTFTSLDYPEAADPTARVWTLVGGDGIVVGELFTPTFEPAGLLVFELEDLATSAIDPPADVLPLTVGVDHTGVGLTAFDAAGQLHLLDLATGQSNASLEVTDPVELPAGVEGLGAPKPTVRTIADAMAYISDPAAGTIVEVDLDDLDVGRRLQVGGIPAFTVVLGRDAVAGASGA